MSVKNLIEGTESQWPVLLFGLAIVITTVSLVSRSAHKQAVIQSPSVPIVEFVHGYAETKADLPNWTPYVPTNEAARIMIPLYWAGVCDGYAAAMKEGKTNLTELYDTMARKMDRTVAGR